MDKDSLGTKTHDLKPEALVKKYLQEVKEFCSQEEYSYIQEIMNDFIYFLNEEK